MNKSVVGSSAILLGLGLVAGLLPSPGPWLMVPFVVGAWALVVFQRRTPGPRPSPVPLEVPLPRPEPVMSAPEQPKEILPGSLVEELHRFRATQEVLLGLKDLVVTDTESAVVRLTDALFTLVRNSEEVSRRIETSLTFLTSGDSGLGKTVGNLEAQVKVFEALALHFGQLKDGLTSDIDALSQAVGSINQFSDTLSDLSDQTNVLAINASIEAARVGIHGRGFAVIANHVQTLSKNSKAISDKMAKTIREVVSNVESSFGRQTVRIQESEGLIHRSEQELRRWADHVAPQLAEVGAMIDESRRLASVVTQQLGDVTVSLQFQDRTKQVMEHLAGILEESAGRVTSCAKLTGVTIPKVLRDDAYQTASRRFTVQEEWALVSSPTSPGISRATKSVELF